MNFGNRTTVLGFTLLGFSVPSAIKITLFFAFLLVYFIALLGNLTMTVLIAFTPKLHTPMYYFLFNLSCLDIGSTTATLPRILVDLLMDRKFIGFLECIAQVFAVMFLATAEVFLLSAMCYDRHVAISHPLNYTAIMTRRLCFVFSTASWIASFFFVVTITVQLCQLPFCGDVVIDNFLCEVTPLLKLACAHTMPVEMVLFVLAGSIAVTTFSIIFLSYVHIIRVILKIPSLEGRRKVFSTCSAHLMVLFLFYGTGVGKYLNPFGSLPGQEKLTSLFYTVFASMLNPIIYSLRNEEVKMALRKSMHRVKRYT